MQNSKKPGPERGESEGYAAPGPVSWEGAWESKFL